MPREILPSWSAHSSMSLNQTHDSHIQWEMQLILCVCVLALGKSTLSQGKRRLQGGVAWGHLGAVLKCVKGFCGEESPDLSQETPESEGDCVGKSLQKEVSLRPARAAWLLPYKPTLK